MRLGQNGTSFTSGEMELFPMIYVLENTTVNCIHAILVGRNKTGMMNKCQYMVVKLIHKATATKMITITNL